MMSLGWGDPIESQITLAYRRKGEKCEHEFSGPVAVLGEDRKTLTWLKRDDLPLREGRLDLSSVPVVGIGGKRKSQTGRVEAFLSENPSFQGAFVLYPGTGNWDLGEGMLFVTSREILSGRRVSGGKPEIQFTNERWLRDGRYVADRVKMLHGKVLETLATEVEQEPGAEKISDALMKGNWAPFAHAFVAVLETVVSDLRQLEERRVLLTGERVRDMSAFVRAKLTDKLQGARFVRDIPESITVTAEEIAPELVSQRDNLGTIVIPGVGRRLAQKKYSSICLGAQVPVVALSVEEFRQIESWPFTKVFPVLTEIEETRGQLDYGLRDAIAAPEAERLGKILEYFAKKWLDVQRDRNCPKDEKVTDPREADTALTPDPVVWGYDLLTGEAKTAYAALVHDMWHLKGGISDYGWSIRWYDDAQQASKADAEARREAESYITARRLEAELADGAISADDVLVGWGGHYRVMGATGNCDYWVVCPNGALRDPDEIAYRKRYTSEGGKQWKLVGPKELALTWRKAYTAAPHEFVVDKLPTGGCAAEQLATVERLEREISERFYGTTGMSGAVSPEIGDGWGLNTPKPAAQAAPVTLHESKPIDPSKLDLSGLFGGAVRIDRKRR